MSVIIKGVNAFDMSIVSNIKNVQSPYIKFQNIYFKCESIEDAGGTIFVKRKKGKWIRDEFGSRCESCGLYAYRDKFGRPWESDYCPLCGADMREEQDGRSI